MNMGCHHYGDFGLFYGRAAYDAGAGAPAEAPKPAFTAPAEKLDQSDEMKKMEGLRGEANLKVGAVRDARKALDDKIASVEKAAHDAFDKSDKSAESKSAFDAYMKEIEALRLKVRGISDELRDRIDEQDQNDNEKLRGTVERLIAEYAASRAENADLRKGAAEWQSKLSDAKFKEALDRLGNNHRDDFDAASKKIAEGPYNDFYGSDNKADASDKDRYENYENAPRSRTEGYLRAMMRMDRGDDAHHALTAAYSDGNRFWIDNMITLESLEKNVHLGSDVQAVEQMVPQGTFLTENERVYIATLYREAERMFGVGSPEKAGAYREFLKKRIGEIAPRLAENTQKGRLAKNNPEEFVKCAKFERNLVMTYVPTPQDWVAGRYPDGPETAAKDPETALNNGEKRNQYQKNLESFVARIEPLVRYIKDEPYGYLQKWRVERDSGVAKQNADGSFRRGDITNSHIDLQEANMKTGTEMYVKYWQDTLRFVTNGNSKAAKEAADLSSRLDHVRLEFWTLPLQQIKNLMVAVSKLCGKYSPEPAAPANDAAKKEKPVAKKDGGTDGAKVDGVKREKGSGKPSSKPSSGKPAPAEGDTKKTDAKKDDTKVDEKKGDGKPAEKKDEAAETIEEKTKRIEREIRKDRLPALAPADKMHFKVEKAGDGFQVLFKKEVFDMITQRTGFVDGVPLNWILTPGGDVTIDKRRATVKDGEYVSEDGLYAKVKYGSILSAAGAATAGAEKPAGKPSEAGSKPGAPERRTEAGGTDAVGGVHDNHEVSDSYSRTHIQSVEEFLKDPKYKEKFDGSLSPNQRKMYQEFIAQGMNPGGVEHIDKGAVRAWLVHTPERGRFYWSAEKPTKEKPYPKVIENLNVFVLDRYVKEFDAWVDKLVNMGARAIEAAERLARTDSEQHRTVSGTTEIYEGSAGLIPEAFGRDATEQQVGIIVRGLLKDMSKNKVMYKRTVEFGKDGELVTEAYSYLINGEKIDGAAVTGGRPKGNRATRVIYRDHLSKQVREEIVKRVVKNGNLG